jgi:hypothetical protein
MPNVAMPKPCQCLQPAPSTRASTHTQQKNMLGSTHPRRQNPKSAWKHKNLGRTPGGIRHIHRIIDGMPSHQPTKTALTAYWSSGSKPATGHRALQCAAWPSHPTPTAHRSSMSTHQNPCTAHQLLSASKYNSTCPAKACANTASQTISRGFACHNSADIKQPAAGALPMHNKTGSTRHTQHSCRGTCSTTSSQP